jgi:hypothetical protein
LSEHPEVPTSMTDDAHRVLVNYIRDVADRIGLRDWQFDLARDVVPEKNRIAQVEVWGDSVTATMWIGESFWKYGPRMQREVVVHELIHCHTDRLYRRARDVARNLGREAYMIALDSFDQQHEFAVDGIAAAWARMLPFIDWTSQEPLYTEYEASQDRIKTGEVQPKDEVVV